MLWGQPDIPLPEIEPAVDEITWEAPAILGVNYVAPMAGMRATVFHHTCKLMILGRQAVEKL